MSGTSVAASPPLVYSQIMPAAPLWRAVYIGECAEHESSAVLNKTGFRLWEMPLIGWALIADSDEVRPLVFVHDLGVLPADDSLIGRFLGIRTPRVYMDDFLEKHGYLVSDFVGERRAKYRPELAAR